MLRISILAGLFLATTTASATLYNVPSDHESIQGAIEASADGDTVLVHPGF